MAYIAGIFFLYTLIGYLFHFQSIAYYLWGFRNNFRMYAVFFVFISVLNEEDAESCFKALNVLFWVNIVVSLFQFFALGYEQDYLGGIFGVERGSNAYSIVFFSVMMSCSLLSMMNGAESMFVCLIKCAMVLMLAVLAELYAFFLVFVLILVLATIWTKSSWRKGLLYVAIVFFFYVSSIFMVQIFGEGSAISVERIMARMFSSNYSSQGDLGRLTAIPTIARTILTDAPGRLFGLGLGNCDTSTFAICNSVFYQNHSQLHYTWFSSAFLFLETGYVGLILYIGFFAASLIQACRKMRKKEGNLLYCQIAAIISVLGVVFTYYNSALRTEAGYVLYFALALPYVKTAGQKASIRIEESN